MKKKTTNTCPDCGHETTRNEERGENWCKTCGTVKRDKQREPAPPSDSKDRAKALARFDAWTEQATDAELAARDYVTVRKAAGPGFISAWHEMQSMMTAEQRARELVRLGKKVVRRGVDVMVDKSTPKTQPSEAAAVLRESLVLSPGAMPAGPVGDALRALSPDALQIVNLRLTRNANGRLLSWREVSQRFERSGKPGKAYTDERCRQIYKTALESSGDLARYVEGMTAKAEIKLTRDRTDAEEIEAMTNESAFDESELRDEDRRTGYRVDKSPRKPVYLPNRTR